MWYETLGQHHRPNVKAMQVRERLQIDSPAGCVWSGEEMSVCPAHAGRMDDRESNNHQIHLQLERGIQPLRPGWPPARLQTGHTWADTRHTPLTACSLSGITSSAHFLGLRCHVCSSASTIFTLSLSPPLSPSSFFSICQSQQLGGLNH